MTIAMIVKRGWNFVENEEGNDDSDSDDDDDDDGVCI